MKVSHAIESQMQLMQMTPSENKRETSQLTAATKGRQLTLTNTWIYVSKSLQVSSYDCVTTELLSYRKDDKDTDCIVLMSTMKCS